LSRFDADAISRTNKNNLESPFFQHALEFADPILDGQTPVCVIPLELDGAWILTASAKNGLRRPERKIPIAAAVR
jgi:hypothetical protein